MLRKFTTKQVIPSNIILTVNKGGVGIRKTFRIRRIIIVEVSMQAFAQDLLEDRIKILEDFGLEASNKVVTKVAAGRTLKKVVVIFNFSITGRTSALMFLVDF